MTSSAPGGVRQWRVAATLLTSLTVLGCTAQPPSLAADVDLERVCSEPRPQICTMDYTPVCGLRDSGIRCIDAPCPSREWKTYSNGCSACADPDVIGYRSDACDGD